MTQATPTVLLENSRQLPDQRWEQRRRQFVKAVFAIYWLLVFEGALRKWVAPHYAKELFFIRDPFVVWAYYLAWTGRMRPKKSIFLAIGLVFSLIAVPLVILQFAATPYVTSVILSMYGWRNYFFYLPLAFLIAKYVKAQEIESLMRWTLIVVIPIALLVYAQSKSPATAVINQGTGTGDDVYKNSGVAGGIVRTEGTFTSVTGQQAFVVSVVAILLASWLRPKAKRPLHGVALIAASAAGAACVALSGSRGTIVAAGIVFAASIVTTLLTGGGAASIQKLMAPVLLVMVGLLVAPLVFPEQIKAIQTRWENAGASEEQHYGSGGIFSRAIYELASFRFLIAKTPPQGYQLGLGGNAAGAIEEKKSVTGNFYDARLLAFSDVEFGAVESDWGRQVVELGPALGLSFIAFRIAFVIWLGKEAVAATKRLSDPLPLLLFTFLAIFLFSGQITGHGTLNGYAWLFSGFCMAINSKGLAGSERLRRSLRRNQFNATTIRVGRYNPQGSLP